MSEMNIPTPELSQESLYDRLNSLNIDDISFADGYKDEIESLINALKDKVRDVDIDSSSVSRSDFVSDIIRDINDLLSV